MKVNDVENQAYDRDEKKFLYILTNGQKTYSYFKCFFDVLFAAIALFFLTPIFLILFVIIELTSRGPAIFSQKRIGQYGKAIHVYKFRTMTSKAPKNKATNDFENSHEYITKIGRFLRVTSLDELPQLINIIKGDMSIIGPRPLIPDEVLVHQLRQANDVYLVKPGLTGLAQVNGRDFLDVEEKVKFDTEYLHNMSFKLDFKIFIKSIGVVFKRQGLKDNIK